MLGIDIEFVEDLGAGINGSFNVRTGKLKIAKTNIGFFKSVRDAIIDFFKWLKNRFKRPQMDIGTDAAIKLLNKQLDKIEDMYEEALVSAKFKQTDEGKASEVGGEMYAITREDVKLIQSIGKRKSLNDLTEDELKILESVAQKYYREMGVKSPFFRRWFGDWRADDKDPITLVTNRGDNSGEYVNNDTKWKINNSSKIHNEKHDSVVSIIGRTYLPYLNDIIKYSVLLNSEVSNKTNNSIMYHSLYAIVKKDANKKTGNLVKLIVEEQWNPNGDTIKRGYKIVGFKEISVGVQKVHSKELAFSLPTDNMSISDLFNLVKTYDKDFNPKPTSLVLNEDGTPKEVYHGTQKFGFSKFDISKSDDKSTIFLADSPELASTYSGVTAIRSLKEVYSKDIDSMSLEELSSELIDAENKYYTEDTGRDKANYTVYNFKKSNKLIKSVNNGIDELKVLVDEKIKELADKMATDWDDATAKEHKQLVSLKEAVYGDEIYGKMDYSKISTQLYMMIHHTDIFKNISDKLATLEKNIRLMNKLSTADISDGIIVKEGLGGYTISLMTKQEASDELRSIVNRGNYATYAKMVNPLIVDVKGRDWNDIRDWSDSLIPDADNLKILNESSSYYLVNKTNDMRIPGAVVPQTSSTENLSELELISLMRNEARNIWAIRTESKKKTRDIADIAKQWGYDGVIFKNILDNGGQSYNTEFDNLSGDVYVVFDPNQIKSVDNGGTFSSWNDDIMLSKSPKRTSKLKDITPEYVRSTSPDLESFKKLVVQTMEEEIERMKNPKTVRL